MKNLLTTLEGQGAKSPRSRFSDLEKTGLVTQEPTARNAAALLVAITAPTAADIAEYTLDRLNAANDQGRTFGDAMKAAFELAPHETEVSQVAICQNFPWMRVSYLNGDIQEFTQADFQPQGIRSDVVISGGTISILCLKLARPTTSGWTDKIDNTGAGIENA